MFLIKIVVFVRVCNLKSKIVSNVKNPKIFGYVWPVILMVVAGMPKLTPFIIIWKQTIIIQLQKKLKRDKRQYFIFGITRVILSFMN